MPWYFAIWDGAATHATACAPAAGAFCFWQADPWASACGPTCAAAAWGPAGRPHAQRVRRRVPGRPPTRIALRGPARILPRRCARPRGSPAQPVYGHNDWYWAYGEQQRDHACSPTPDHIVELSPPARIAPSRSSTTAGSPSAGAAGTGVGLWDRGNERFPDMAGLAERDARGAGRARASGSVRCSRPTDGTRRLATRPGPADARPLRPEVLEKVADDIRRLRAWGFELVKHDYSTFDILGRWGFQMGSSAHRRRLDLRGGTAPHHGRGHRGPLSHHPPCVR